MIFEKIREKLFHAVQEAKVLQETTDSYGYMMVKKGLNHATDIVNEVEAEYNNGWIPCSERLPEEGQCVVVQVKDHYALEDGVPIQIRKFDTRYEGHNWKEIGDGRWLANHCVIAWQPFPEPYTLKGE